MQLESLQNWSNVFILVGVVLTAFGGFGSYYYGKKSDEEKDRQSDAKDTALNQKIEILIEGNNKLQKEIEPFKKYAKELYPKANEEDALKLLKDDFDTIKSEIKTEKDTIKKLQSKVKIRFSGKWHEQPYPDSITPPFDFTTIIIEAEGLNKIELYQTNFYNKTLSKNSAEFYSSQENKAGDSLIGKNILELKKYNIITFYMPIIMPERMIDPNLIVEEIDLELFLNDKIRGFLKIKEQALSKVSQMPDNPIIWYSATSLIMIEPVINLYNLFNFDEKLS